MSETPSQPRATPARRRQGRNAGRSGAHKAYASENDAVNIDPSRFDGTPSTPQKTDCDSPVQHGTQNGSKQRPKNKSRAKNPPMSPESSRPGRQTPPHTSASMKSGAAPAFAGATFHASPAPSALPLPSFLARPSTDSPSSRAAHDIRQEPSPPTDTDVPTPTQPSSMPAAQESPLDFMFRAHRQEIERKRRESSTGCRPAIPNTASPLSYSPFEPRSLPKPSNAPQNARSQPRFRQGGIEGAELDGTPGRPLGPAFSTPYHERIKAARMNSNRSATTQQPSQQPPNPTLEDPTEALKKFLFSGSPSPASRPASNGPTSDRCAPAQPMAAHPTASVVNGHQDSRPNNLQAMENDLRRILKLDLAPGSSGHEQRLFS